MLTLSFARQGISPQATPSAAGDNGFTLVEAVLALAILSISVFALIETTARCLAVVRMSRNYQIARAVLEQGEAEYPLVATNSPDQNKVSPVAFPNGFTFERHLTEAEGDDDGKLFEVRTRVSWSEAGRASFEEVFSLLYCTAEDLP